MFSSIRLAIPLVVIGLVSSAVFAAEDVDITGEYRCEGENGDGTKYQGKVKITKKEETFILQWTIGEASHIGVALFDGETLSVCFASPEGGGGIVVYILQKDGKTFEGKWAPLGGDGKTLKETLRKGKGVIEA